MSTTTQDRIIKLPEVQNLTAKSRSSIYQGMNEGTFPKSIHLGIRAVGWKLSDILNWIEARQAVSKARDL